MHLHIGWVFTCLATADEGFVSRRVSTNIGWPPGAVLINAQDYARAWESQQASAYEIMLAPGASPAKCAARSRGARGRIGPRSADRRAARRTPAGGQPAGSAAAQRDIHASTDRRGAGDGGRDRKHDLATPARLAQLKLEGYTDRRYGAR